MPEPNVVPVNFPVERGPAPAPAAAATAAEVEEERERFGALVKRRLGLETIGITDARDGLRDCFVATYLGGVTHGLEKFALRGEVGQVERVIESMFRRRLREHGASWEAPTLQALQATKDDIDTEVHFDALPAELRAVHDQVCTLLIGKVRGDLGHVGDKSAIAASRAAVQVVVRADDRPGAPTGEDPVAHQLRLTIATLLEQMAQQARAGDPVESLRERAGQLGRLLELHQQLSPKG